MMSYDELKTLVADYMHRTNLTDKIPGFIDLATRRIGRDLRSQANTVILDPFEVTAQNFALPADYRNMKEISYKQGERRIQLRGANVDTMSSLPQTGEGARRYRVNGLFIEIVPFASKDYRLIYYNEPEALEEDADTNSVLTQYPYLYVYAALVEGMFYIRDFNGRKGALETYTSEISELNLQSANADIGAQMTIG